MQYTVVFWLVFYTMCVLDKHIGMAKVKLRNNLQYNKQPNAQYCYIQFYN